MTALVQPVRRLADSFGRIFAPEESAALLCPRCDKPLTEGHECKPFVMKRRFFLGLLGASAAQLALRDQGVPIRTARTQVWAHSGDMLYVEHQGKRFTVAYDEGQEAYYGFMHANVSFPEFSHHKPWNPNLLIPEFSSPVQFHPIPDRCNSRDTGFSGEMTLEPEAHSLGLITLHPGARQVRMLNVRDADSGDSLPYTIFRMGKPLPKDLAEKRIALRNPSNAPIKLEGIVLS